MDENPYKSPETTGADGQVIVRWRLLIAGVLTVVFGATAGGIACRETMRGILVQNFYHGEWSWLILKSAEIAAMAPGVILLLFALAPLLNRLRRNKNATHHCAAPPPHGREPISVARDKREAQTAPVRLPVVADTPAQDFPANVVRADMGNHNPVPDFISPALRYQPLVR